VANVRRTAVVPYSPAQMFELVDDVNAYSEFLPWCRSSEVLSRGEDEVMARIELAKGSVRRTFTTRNRRQRNKMIEVRLVEGPFRRLEGFWRFDAMGEKGCRVRLDLDYEFSSRLVGLAIGPVFHQLTNTLVDAFTRRAAEIYGRDRHAR
jgi:ribosome-associated toxin RatA of RatAB toxin-antitoxin module